jgi:hypothetical protein
MPRLKKPEFSIGHTAGLIADETLFDAEHLIEMRNNTLLDEQMKNNVT